MIARVVQALLVLGWCASVSAAQTFNVNTTDDTPDKNLQDNQCADDANRCSLRAAIQQANASPGKDIIKLGALTYYLTNIGVLEELAATGDLDITDSVVIQGQGRDQTIIDGINQDRIFDIKSAVNVTIQDLTLQNGLTRIFVANTERKGGGILVNAGAALTIFNCIIANNESYDYAGGIYFGGSHLEMSNCIIDRNSGAFGGGIHIATSSTANITGSTFTNNYSDFGGGLYNTGPNTIVNNSLFTDNAGSGGSAIGAGFSTSASVMHLKNSTLSGNYTDARGTVFAWFGATIYISNSTIVFNIGSSNAAVDSSATVFISNSIVAGNRNDSGVLKDCHGKGITSLGHNILGSCSNSNILIAASDQVGTSANPINPMLGPLADNGGDTFTYALLPESPAIDAGNPVAMGSGGTACESQDQRGVNRAYGGTCDIGAYEEVGRADMGRADLWVTLVQSSDEQANSSIQTHVLQIGNKGPEKSVAPSLQIVLPVGGDVQNMAGDGWVCNTVTNTILCDRLALETDEQSSLEVNYWPPNAARSIEVTAVVESTTTDPELANNQTRLLFDIKEPADKDDLKSSPDSGQQAFDDSVFSSSQTSSQSSNHAAVGNTIAQPGSTPYKGNWPHDWNSIGHLGEEDSALTDKSKNAYNRHLSDMESYENSWLSMDSINLRDGGAGSQMLNLGAGALFFAGVISLYMQSMSFFGLLLSFPLYAPIDPVPVVMISASERKRRTELSNRQRKIENNSKLGGLLDETQEPSK